MDSEKKSVPEQSVSTQNTTRRHTTPVGIKVSVQVHPSASAALSDRAIFPPHPILGQKHNTQSTYKRHIYHPIKIGTLELGLNSKYDNIT